MKRRQFLRSLLPVIAVGSSPVLLKSALAEQPVQQTAILIGDMHCADCAKKIASRLYAVPGVRGVRAEVKTGIAHVTPQASKQPSPRALWEAVELADFTPKKLVGPYGSFVEKPVQ